MNENRDFLFFIDKIVSSQEFWKVNYYILSMKKAPHGGVVSVSIPNLFLRRYQFKPWTFLRGQEITIPYFMKDLVETAVKLYSTCNNIDMEEMLRFAFSGDLALMGLRFLDIKEEYKNRGAYIKEHLFAECLDNKSRITDYFSISSSLAIYALLLALLYDKSIVIESISEILPHEHLRQPTNKYGLTKLENVTFMRQGFQIDDTYYQYNLFIDPTISSPGAKMPYIFEIITEETNGDIYLRCDDELAVPASQKFETATTDMQKFYGINVDFANIDKILHKEIIVHTQPSTDHRILVIIKPDFDNDERFYHIEIEELWNTDGLTDKFIMATFLHAKYYPAQTSFTHIDFTVNQYDLETYRQKHTAAKNSTGIPVDKYCDIHYKIWCIEAPEISVQTWSKIVCATLDEPFRDIFLEIFE